MENVTRWLPLLVWAGLVFTLSSVHGTSFPKSNLWNYDKILHALEYAAGGALVCYALGGRSFRVAALAALFASLYGATDELHQWFVPFRSCDWRDWIADTSGGTLGAVLFWRWRARRK